MSTEDLNESIHPVHEIFSSNFLPTIPTTSTRPISSNHGHPQDMPSKENSLHQIPPYSLYFLPTQRNSGPGTSVVSGCDHNLALSQNMYRVAVFRPHAVVKPATVPSFQSRRPSYLPQSTCPQILNSGLHSLRRRRPPRENNTLGTAVLVTVLHPPATAKPQASSTLV